MFEDLSILQIFDRGGYIMILLGILSVFSIGVMLERAWFFLRFGRWMERFSREFRLIKDEGSLDALSEFCKGDASPLANILDAGILKIDDGKAEISEAMELSARREISNLERYLGVLGTIGNTAPFIGLFGTVLGIIRAFHDLAGAEGAGPSVVADGIAEALIATAAGLFVAIPAVIAYNYFTRKVNSYALEIETKAKGMIDTLCKVRKDKR